jgi:hypothetical protein
MKNIEKFYEILKNEHCLTMESPCKFHIGRGGRFWNGGHKSFLGFEVLNQEWDDLFLNEETGEAHDGAGNVIEAPEWGAEFGLINIDFQYDTTYVCRLDECDNDELKLIAKYCDIYADLVEFGVIEYEEDED